MNNTTHVWIEISSIAQHMFKGVKFKDEIIVLKILRTLFDFGICLRLCRRMNFIIVAIINCVLLNIGTVGKIQYSLGCNRQRPYTLLCIRIQIEEPQQLIKFWNSKTYVLSFYQCSNKMFIYCF